MSLCLPNPMNATGAVIAAAARQRRHLLFDLDGTLIDSNAGCVAILQAMLAERGSSRKIDERQARSLMSQGGERLVAGILAQDCGNAADELAEFRSRYLVHSTNIDTVFSGVLPGLQRLADAGFIMAICSNKPQVLCEKVLADTGLDAFFTAIVGSQTGRAPKPAPDLLHTVTGMLACDGAECIFIGDSDLDYRIARDADIPFAFMTYGYADAGWQPDLTHDWHVQASESFDHFDHLVETLLGGKQVSA